MSETDIDLGTVGLGDEFVAEMIPKVRQVLEQGEAHERFLRELVNKQRAENSKTQKLLAQIDPDNVPAKTNGTKRRKIQGHVGVARSNGTATGFGISMERAATFADKIKEMCDEGSEFVTQKEVYKALGSDQSKASSAFKYLRSIGYIRKAGRTDSGAERWAILDADAYDKVTKAVMNGG